MLKKSASVAILEQLAAEQRRVLSDWRGLLLLRRATIAIPAHERRWSHLPQTTTDLTPLFRQMRQREEIAVFDRFRSLYHVTVPYARQGAVDEREVLFELHPYAVLGHLSALVFHGLTSELPKRLTVTVSADGSGGLLPIGTEQVEWEGISRPVGRRPPAILGRPVEWIKTPPNRFFGFADYRPSGLAMRYTTLERTLIDGVQYPELNGGIANVLRAWSLARDSIDLDVLTYQVERYGVAILRQRVGFIIDRLELTHPKLDRWRQRARRGGSSRLVGAEPFASTYDERWNLSINAPVDALADWPL